MKKSTESKTGELRRTELLGWCSVGIVACSLVPAGFAAAGADHPAVVPALIALVCVGLTGLMLWYLRVRQAIRKLNALIGALEDRGREQGLSLQNLKELERVRESFMHMASHQLRAPLAAMLSCMRVLMGEDVSEEDARKLLHDAHARGEDMMELVNDILQLSQAESLMKTETNMAVEEIDVERMVREITDFFAPRAAEKDVTFAVVTDEPPGTLYANKRLFNQLAINLVSNAFRYSDPGRQVVVKLSGSKKSLVMEVKNWGLVIPEADRDNIFKEFWRGGEAKKFVGRGTGLGLSVVKNIVDGWGGWIDVKSDAENGTRFNVEIPKNIKRGGNSDAKEKNSDH